MGGELPFHEAEAAAGLGQLSLLQCYPNSILPTPEEGWVAVL